MEQHENDGKSGGKREFPLPTQVLFCLLIALLGFFSAWDPLGVIGLPSAILAAGMSVLLTISYGDAYRKLFVVLASHLLPFAVAAVMLQSVHAASAALFPLAMALPIVLTVRMRLGRAASIAAAAGCSALLWFIYLALAVAAQQGALNVEAITTAFDASLAPMKELLAGLTYESEGKTLPYYSTEDIELMFYYVKALLFGTLVAVMLVCSYFVTLAARLISNIFDVTALLPMGMRVCMRATMTEDGPRVDIIRDRVPWRIEIDSVSANVFIAAYIISLIASFVKGGEPLYIALQNLLIILSPGFFYCGARDVILGFRGKGSLMGVSKITVVFGIVLLFINPASMLMLIAAVGVLVTLRENRMKRLREKNRNGKE